LNGGKKLEKESKGKRVPGRKIVPGGSFKRLNNKLRGKDRWGSNIQIQTRRKV